MCVTAIFYRQLVYPLSSPNRGKKDGMDGGQPRLTERVQTVERGKRHVGL